MENVSTSGKETQSTSDAPSEGRKKSTSSATRAPSIIVGIVASVLIFVTDTLSNYWFTGLFTGLLTFLYFLAFESTQGWTIGKKLLGLSVHGPGGAPKPTVQQSAIRNSWTLLPIIPFVGGLLGVIAIVVIAVTINSSPTKQGKHDELAGGTQVVKG